jgi:hypothetical protein
MGNLESICTARAKMREFLSDNNTFTVTISAFLQAQPEIIDEFAKEDENALDLVKYFCNICDPDEIGNIIENFSNELLYKIFELDFENYQKLKVLLGRKSEAANYFDLKSSKYWRFVSQQKICEVIAYLTKVKGTFSLAAQFLVILSPDIISKFNDLTNLSEDDERNLFLALEDNIYNIPLISPKIYDHMLEIFKDNMEIFFILETMGPLVRRRGEIEDISQSFLRYEKKSSQKLSIQWIYSELFGLEYELVVEVLAVLTENSYLTISEKNTLQTLLKTGSLDPLSEVRLEILKQ